jgi:hypothetical protein
MNVFESFRYRPSAIHRLALVALVTLSACGNPATPTRIRYPNPVTSPTPSFMGGTKELNCEEEYEIVAGMNKDLSQSLLRGGKSQFHVGLYKDGQAFMRSSGTLINLNRVGVIYPCSPYQDALELYNELRGK